MNAMLRLSGLALSLCLLIAGTASAQVQISGRVADAETGETLPNANVVIEGTTRGAAADIDGQYVLTGLEAGTYTLTASYLGYEPMSRLITVRSSDLALNFDLEAISQALEGLEVFASRAVERETPVAFSNVDKAQIQRELASRDVPLVLNATPSVYATAQGGGAGDARINVRGFNQRNVAIMINGVPVNDMENGWVYWSNWDGVGDATSSIQLQRGLSAVNLATPSIGGTLNIITDPSSQNRSVAVKQEVGNDGFFKTTAMLNSGLINDRFAVSLLGVRKVGDGYYDGTWADAWAYYGAAGWNINSRHRLDLYAVGAPQRHGQNLYFQNIAAYDHDYARDLFSDHVLDTDEDGNGTADVLDYFKEAGRRWNENVSPVSSSYNGKQAVGSSTLDRYEDGFINERENFFHKPQVNLNWYGQFTDDLLLTTVLYYSGGRGGGTGTSGSLVWDYSGPSRVVDYDGTISRNASSADGSTGILRNSRNNQWTVGAISKLRFQAGDRLTLETGLDWRTAEIEHYREVRDLLGGTFYRRTDSDFWDGPQDLGLGDKFDYDNTNTVDWWGGFVQGEYVTDGMTAYGMAGLSTVKYSYTDHFTDDGSDNELFAETDNIWGYQVKGGGLVNVTDEYDVFANAGYVSKVPIFDGAIDDVTGQLNPDPQNEAFVSLEAGVIFHSTRFPVTGKLNLYHTSWKDQTITRNVVLQNGDEGIISLLGLDSRHYGLEAELGYQPFQKVRFDVATSFGNWSYTDDVNARYVEDAGDPTSVQRLNLYTKDLRVGDAPQSQMVYGVTVYPTDGLFFKALGRTYANHWANFDPLGRTDPDDRTQSWKTPSYTVFDLHTGYTIPSIGASRFDVRVFANLFNVFDTIYIQDALDNSPFNAWTGNGVNHQADDAEVFLGLPRSFNFGTTLTFR